MPTPISVRPPFRTRGQNWLPPTFVRSLVVTGSGGVEIGGSGDVAFRHGGSVVSDVVVEWDFDNDGDFSDSLENITPYVLSMETMTGRDWPSLLTGKAGPGKFRATLDNSDDRFSYFNTDSPLATAPFSLKTGRKLRVRTSTAGNPDPTPLAKDRFGRADGALGTPEVGAAWSGPLASDFLIVSNTARPQTEGTNSIGLIDVGQTAYYAQARFSEVGVRSNAVGLTYRYQDSTNYSLALLDITSGVGSLLLGNVVAGVFTSVASEAVEPYDEITIGVLVSGASVTLYHEGVPVLSATAIQTDETEVGIYANWVTGDLRPVADDFYVWTGLPVETEGILWTGDVATLTNSVVSGPEKYAVLEGEGWLSRLAGQSLQPLRSVYGRKTGVLVGDVLARTNLLHPPGPIDEGDITTGAVFLGDMTGIEAARQFEEVEFGFLRETQEGQLAFDARTARAGSTSVATFSDDPSAQFGYTGVQPLDWRREVTNRVIAGVAPSVPSGILTGGGRVTGLTSIQLTYIAGDVGDLHILNIAVARAAALANRKWVIPPGWTQVAGPTGDDLSEAGADADLGGNHHRILARVEDHAVTSDLYIFGTGLSTSDSYVAQSYTISDWFGSISGGISVSDYTLPSDFNIAGDDPPAVFPPWGPAPSLFLAWSIFLSIGADISTSSIPLGYTDGDLTPDFALVNPDVTLSSARRFGVVEVENPGSFHTVWDSSGWLQQSVTVAIRGANGGLPSGVVTVQLDDLDSQADHNAIRTSTDSPVMFASEADAETYAQLVLDSYADDRPIVELRFVASKSGAYRGQAIRRRVNDRITLVATNNAGLGISQDFYIENVAHQWRSGNTMWETVWQLSPV